MHIEHRVGPGHEFFLDKVRYLLSNSAISPSEKCTIHISVVDRGRPLAGFERRVVQGWNADDDATHTVQLYVSYEFADDDRPLELVTMIAASEKNGWTRSIRNDRYGNANRAPGRVVPGPRQDDVAKTLAVSVDRKREVGTTLSCGRHWQPLFGHGRIPSINRVVPTFMQANAVVSTRSAVSAGTRVVE